MKTRYKLLVFSMFIFLFNTSLAHAEDDKFVIYDMDTGEVTEEIIENIDMELGSLPASEPLESYNKDLAIGSKEVENRTIFGKDDRYRVDTTKYPYTSVVRLGFSSGNRHYGGTGFFINEDTVITAAHCVYEEGQYTLSHQGYKMKIQPGFDRGYMPYGQADISTVAVPEEWKKGAGRPGATYDTKNDIAVIKLKSKLGRQTGYFGLSTNINPNGFTPYVNVTGYPGSNLPTDSQKYGAMYNSSGPIDSISSDRFTYRIDMTSGHSGGPVYDNNYSVYGINIAESPSENIATRINNKWFNYIMLESGEIPKPLKVNKMVTIKSPNYTIWQNLKWKKKSDTSNKKGNTYKVKYEYDHFNGETYYSLYDSNDNWQGYINKTGVQELKAETFNKNVSIRSENYNIWQNFFFQKKSDTKGKLGRVYKAKYKYKHYNGDTYYSLYDGNGTWQGYINSSGTVEVNAVSYNKKVTITKSTYNIWGNFFFNTKNGHTSNHVGKTYDAKYIYTLGDGVKYYSLYNGSTWLGYLNTGSTQMARRLEEYNDDDKYEEPIKTEDSSSEDGNIDPIDLEDENIIESSTDSSTSDSQELNSSEENISENSLDE